MSPEDRKSDGPIVVVKLGGSLTTAAELPHWLECLSLGGGRTVVVPGGGPFADQVRDLQDQLHFDDATAHHLAIVAMEQFGRVMAALQSELVPAQNRDEIASALGNGQVPLWMPAEMTIGCPEIPESWDVTSDSLAAWLAGQLSAQDLVLVKSAPRPHGRISAETLAKEGLVDPAFPGFLSRSDARCHYLGPGEADKLVPILQGGGPRCGHLRS